MKIHDNPEFVTTRAELLRGYQPANPQECMLVEEVAAAWQRLDQCRRREQSFFDFQREPKSAGEAEARMWLDKPQTAYSQILKAIREAHTMFDRAVRRIEDVQERRRKSERMARKEEVAKARQPRPAPPPPQPVSITRAAETPTQNKAVNLVMRA